MPIKRCSSNGRPGWKWGDQGKCYVGAGAHAKALRQARAIESTRNARPLKHDPSRTATIRRSFVAELRRRFASLRKSIRRLIVAEDAFGLVSNAPRQRFAFGSSPEKAEEFRRWLAAEIGLVGLRRDDWWKKFIQQAYEKGAGAAFDAVRKPALSDDLDFYRGTREEFLRSSFGQKVAQSQVELLAGRFFDELKGVTAQMDREITRSLVDGLTQGWGAKRIADEMTDRIDISESRAMTIARTEIIRSHAEAQLDAFKDLGVESLGVAVEWSTAGDGRVCELCAELENIVLSPDEARGLIPRHPNAVFAGSSFMSYGECKEIVRAHYRGPAVVLACGSGGKYRTTIGPNHPMMTMRGMVKAAEIKKGDKVLYDARIDRFRRGFDVLQVDDEQIPSIENVFESCLRSNPDSFVSSAGSDFHGDRMFCDGEVEAVVPADGLLRVLDSDGVEQFRETGFMGTDADSDRVSGFGASDFGFDRIGLAPSRDMGSSNSGVLADHWFWLYVHDVSFSDFDGFAFDGTTESGLYCSDGFVVSNCRCAFIPANVGEDKKDQVRDPAEIEKAIDASIEKEIPASEKGKRTVEDQKDKTSWMGADAKIDPVRPKSILDEPEPTKKPRAPRKPKEPKPVKPPKLSESDEWQIRYKHMDDPILDRIAIDPALPRLRAEFLALSKKRYAALKKAQDEVDAIGKKMDLALEGTPFKDRNAEWERRFEELKAEYRTARKRRDAAEDKSKSSFVDSFKLPQDKRMKLELENSKRPQSERVRRGDGTAVIDTLIVKDKDFDARTKEAKSFIGKIVADRIGMSTYVGDPSDGLKVQIHKLGNSERAFQVDYRLDELRNGVFVALNDDTGTMVHELGHAIEAQAHLKRKATEFVNARTDRSGSPREALKSVFPESGYGPDEVGNKDDFDKAFPKSFAYYVGKTYEDGATEVISMGLQKLYEDPALFADMDPEYFDFMIGILRDYFR